MMENFINSLPIIGIGYLGIFVVTGAIILCVSLLHKLTGNNK